MRLVKDKLAKTGVADKLHRCEGQALWGWQKTCPKEQEEVARGAEGPVDALAITDMSPLWLELFLMSRGRLINA